MAEPGTVAASPRRLADFLRERKDEILLDWERIVRRMDVAQRLERPLLLDHMPEFLDDLVHFVDDTRKGHDVGPPEQYPRIHALERLEIGYDLAEVVAEYAALRTCISSLIVREHAPSTRSSELPRLHQAIDQAIGSSVVRFSEARERTLKALDRISTMALVHHDVESLLPHTLEVLLETTASVDSVAIFLREGELLRMRASVGLLPEAAQALVRIGDCFVGRVAQGAAPLFLRDAQHAGKLEAPLFRAAGAHAVYGVPLSLGEELVGVAIMGSRSTYEFSQEDQFLFRTMATRATALLAQARIDAELKSRAAELEAVIESIPEGVYVGDQTGIKRVNAAGLRMLGFDSAGQIGAPIGQLTAALEVRAAATGEPIADEDQVFARALAGRSTTDELLVRRLRGGEERVLRSSGAPIKLGERVIGAVVVTTDITNKAQEERELRAALNFRDRMLGVLSHDLRSPLGVIATSAELLLRKGGLDEAQARSVARIAQNTSRIDRLIRDLLDYTRVKLGRGIPLQPQPCDLLQLCTQVVDNARVLSPDREVRLSASGDTRGRWDPDRALQVISNLVTNALRYSPPDSAVALTLEDQQQAVVLEVHNGGAPIAPALLPTIFDAFQRGGESVEAAQPAGLGLGLYIVQQLVAAHGGDLAVRSTAAQGTTFTVRWPRRG